MKRQLADWWGRLAGRKQKPQKKKMEPPSPWFALGWSMPSGKVVAVIVALVLFGGLAVWIIFLAVRLFGRFWGMADLPEK